MALDMTEALSEYGQVAQIVNGVPELRSVLENAINQGLSPDAFNSAIAETPWYKSHSDAWRSLIMQEATDPATYAANLANSANQVSLLSQSMGRSVDVNSLGLQALMYGWNQDQLKSVIGQGALLQGDSGALLGDAAQMSTHMKEVAASYGVPATDDFIARAVGNIQTGKDTLDGFEAVMRARAKAAFPQFAAQIDSGQTVAQIADPYMATMAKTLEIPQSQVTLDDPYVKKALGNVDPKTGAQTQMPLWQFERQLKDDPRYDQTTQARTDAFSVLHQVGKDFGFAT